jgi:hypothetical protein
VDQTAPPDRSGDRDSGRRNRRGIRIRIVIGSGVALAKLVALVALTTMLVVGFSQRWSAVYLLLLGVPWAIVLGALILAPMASSWFVDRLGQFPMAHRRHPPPSAPGPSSEPREIGLQLPLPAAEVAVAGPGPQMLDWPAFIADLADRLEEALGPGFSARPAGLSLVLRCGELVRRVNLGLILQPPPLDADERAMRACLKLMDEAQMFAMRVRRTQWPSRGDEPLHAEGSLARPQVRVADGALQMAWADPWGVVLSLPPLSLRDLPVRDRGT